MATISVPMKVSHSFRRDEKQEVRDVHENFIEPRAPTDSTTSRNTGSRWKTVLTVILIVAVIAAAVIVGSKIIKAFSTITKYPLVAPADLPKGKPPLSTSGYVKNIFPVMVQETEVAAKDGALQLSSSVKPGLVSLPIAAKIGLSVAMFGLALLGGPAGRVLSKAVDVFTGGI